MRMRFLSVLFCMLVSAPCLAGDNEVAGRLLVFDDDGSWCWFQDERAIVHGDTLLIGSVSGGYREASRRGDVNVIVHDFDTGRTLIVELHDQLELDDHNVPALLALPDGRVMAVYSRHGSDGVIRLRMAEPAGDDLAWGPEVDITRGIADQSAKTYANVHRLASENTGRGRLYDFYRGRDWDPNALISDDGGETWTYLGPLLTGPGRPYVRYASNRVDVIHFTCTDQHPRDADNSIYHGFIRGGAICTSEGVPIGEWGTTPVAPAQLTCVFQGDADNVAWCSDIQLDAEGRPCIVYSVQKESAGLPPGQGGEDHRYRYARWNGEAWGDHEVAFAGRRLYAGEDDYTGLMAIDPRDVNTVYFSTDAEPVTGAPLISAADGERHYEIYRGVTLDGGLHWTFTPITRHSTVDNLRPVLPETDAAHAMLLWLRGRYDSYTSFQQAVVGIRLGETTGPLAPSWHPEPWRAVFSGDVTTEAIGEVASAVAQWQMSHESRHARTDWTQAAFYVGLMTYAEATNSTDLIQWMRRRAEEMEWKLGPRPLHADDHCVGYAYEMLHERFGDDAMIAPTRATFDHMLTLPFDEPLTYEGGITNREWAWCDALFMSPPVLAKMSAITGDPRYLDLMDRLWWKTTAYLYDPDEHLYYRDSRFFDQRASNGAKVFWSRGNGWVIAGLTRVLENMPETFPDRDRYLVQYRDMAMKLASIQTPVGYWASSLLNPGDDPRPETSGTAFYCYALAWGVNRGVLDRETYEPHARRAWTALVNAVHEDGKLGWVQQVSDQPGSSNVHSTEIYASGGFLLAASEMLKMTSTATPANR